MKKPTSCPIAPASNLDYDIAERTVRQLQESYLHVCSASVATAMPEAIGDPHDMLTSLLVDLTLITDGRRGWLVLVHEVEEYDAAVEIDDMLTSLLAEFGSTTDFVTRRAAMHRSTMARARPGTLDLRDPSTVRATLEAAYEAAFAPASATDVEAFLPPFRMYGFALWDELALRELVRENDVAVELISRGRVGS